MRWTYPWLAFAALPGTASAQEDAPLVHASQADYPAGVSAEGDPVHSNLTVRVDANGRVTECRVARPSRDPRLDTESCRILRQRAVFTAPAFRRGRIMFRWYPVQPTAPLPERGDPLLISFGPFIMDADYPATARYRNEQGEVRYSVAVSNGGRPISCTVTVSSNSATLDQQTCALVMQRARFIPKVDDQGRRVTGTYRGAVRWML